MTTSRAAPRSSPVRTSRRMRALRWASPPRRPSGSWRERPKSSGEISYSSMQRETAAGPSSISAPRASSTSALPALLVAARLPCLATTTPAPRATKAAAVETFMVPLASPPVPQVSTTLSGASTFPAKRRMARAKPTISGTASPLTRSAVRSAAVAAGGALPSMMVSRARSASPSVRGSPLAAFLSVSRSNGSGPQEVLQEIVAAAGQDALGVKLDALDRVLAVPDAHDRAVLGPAGYDEALRHGVGLDHERVVPGGLEVLVQSPVDPLTVVLYLRGLAVDGLSAHDLRAEGLADGLVSEAVAQGGYALADPPDEFHRHPGLVGRARTGRDHYPVGVEPGDLLGRDLVVAPHEDLGPELPEVLDQVVRKGVVVVYDEDPHEQSDFNG